jgi:hypothetical protein
MSRELHDLVKRDLSQIPVPATDTWVPLDRTLRLRPVPAWTRVVPVAAVVLILVAALVGGRELAAFRDRSSEAASGVAAVRAVYLTPSFNGSGWIQIDSRTLANIGTRPLLDIAPTTQGSSDTLVSADGSTIVVGDYSGPSPRRTVYDARTGTRLHDLVPAVPMIIDALSADGSLAIGRLGATNVNPMTERKVIIAVSDGQLIREVPAIAPCECLFGLTYAPDLSAVYFFFDEPASTADPVSPRAPRNVTLVRQSTATGSASGRVLLPGIQTTQAASSSPQTNLDILQSPGIALSPDGKRIAALSHDARTLVLIDTASLAIIQTTVRQQVSLLELLRPLIAEAKLGPDQEFWRLNFTPDGHTIVGTLNTVTQQINGLPVRATRETIRLDLEQSLITAVNRDPAGIYVQRMLPDGSALLLIVNGASEGPPSYRVRSLSMANLSVSAERILNDYAEIELLQAPAKK